MNIQNAIEVKREFINRLLTNPYKHFTIPLSYNPDAPDEAVAVLAALTAYANSIRATDADLAGKIDLLIVDMQNQ